MRCGGKLRRLPILVVWLLLMRLGRETELLDRKLFSMSALFGLWW